MPEAALKSIASDKLEDFRAWFQHFLSVELQKWLPSGYSLDEISFSIEVSGAPFGVGLNGTVEVSIKKS